MKNISVTCKDFGTFDLAVIGGGCTGVFAAVRAARLGLKVAVVEKSNCFGGMATSGLVNIWHTLFDVDGKEQIIGGLTDEVEKVIIGRGNAYIDNARTSDMVFDPNAMKVILDDLVVQSGIKIFFHTAYASAVVHEDTVKRVVVCNKDGIGTISASFFVDATGDGDLCRDAGIDYYTVEAVQPPSPTAITYKMNALRLGELISKYGAEFGLNDDWGWGGAVPGLEDHNFRADFHIFGKMCNRADDLTAAEIEGRKKIYALDSLLKKYDNPQTAVVSIGSQLGVRETVHYKTRFMANEHDLLLGKAYEDAVLYGSYRVDVHHQNDNGITFKYLTGETVTYYGKGSTSVYGNWREDKGISEPYAKYYQVPFGILQQDKIRNLIPVGRMIHADSGSFGALRVMVNLNQLGEAAGVAAYLALHENKEIWNVSGKSVRNTLRKGGSRL